MVGADESEVRRRRERIGRDLGDMGVVGTVDQVAERLLALEEAGVERVMLQHLLHDDLESIELIGRELIPKIS